MKSHKEERGYTTASIPLDIAERIDKILAKEGFMSFAEFVRDSVRRRLEEIEKEAA